MREVIELRSFYNDEKPGCLYRVESSLANGLRVGDLTGNRRRIILGNDYSGGLKSVMMMVGDMFIIPKETWEENQDIFNVFGGTNGENVKVEYKGSK